MVEALLGVGLEDDALGHEQVGVGGHVRSPDAAPELVELAEAEGVGVVHDEGVGPGEVHAVLDDGGAHEDVVVAVEEGEHDLLEGPLPHLPVGDGHPGLGDPLLQPAGRRGDGLHLVVHVVDLPAAGQLPPDGRLHQLPLVGVDGCLDGEAVLGGRLDEGHVQDAAEAHLEGPRDGRGREGEDVHVRLELLDLLLVGHPEALLLVHHQEAQVRRLHVLGEEAVGPHEDVHLALVGLGHRLLLLLGQDEAGEHAHGDGEGGEALVEALHVLEGEDGRGAQDHDLPPVLHRLEGGAHGHLGLPEAHVAADEAVHGARRFHVPLQVLHRAGLVGSEVEGELGLELRLPLRVRTVGPSLHRPPPGVELEEVVGDLLDGLPHALLGLLPSGAPEAVQGRQVALGPHVLLDEVHALHGH